jgi:hypothetical protein
MAKRLGATIVAGDLDDADSLAPALANIWGGRSSGRSV